VYWDVQLEGMNLSKETEEEEDEEDPLDTLREILTNYQQKKLMARFSSIKNLDV